MSWGQGPGGGSALHAPLPGLDLRSPGAEGLSAEEARTAVCRAPRQPWLSGRTCYIPPKPCTEAPLHTPTPVCEEKPKVWPWGHCLSGSWSPSCLACPPLPQVSHGEQSTDRRSEPAVPFYRWGELRP